MLSETILDLGSAPTRKPMKVKVQVIQFVHFPRSKIVSESSFYTKSYIITILKKIQSVLSKKNGAPKNGFPIVFLTSDVALVGVNYGDRLWFLQCFWSIFYNKITGYFKNFDIWTLVIYLSPLNRANKHSLKTGQLVLGYKGSGQAGQGRADPTGAKADRLDKWGLVGYQLSALVTLRLRRTLASTLESIVQPYHKQIIEFEMFSCSLRKKNVRIVVRKLFMILMVCFGSRFSFKTEVLKLKYIPQDFNIHFPLL